MKKVIILMLSLFLISNLEAKKVKFAVDMSAQTINATGIHISGDFQVLAGYPDDWSSSSTSLTKEGSTLIYSIVVDIPANRKYEYKFVNGDQFYDAEFVPIESRVGFEFNDNRWIYIDSLRNDTTIIGAIKFGENAPANYNLLRFKVNMQNEASINSNGVHLIGPFSNWNALDNFMYSFDGIIFEKILYFQSGDINFKFVNGNTNSGKEVVPSACSNTDGNRTKNLNTHLVMDPICFSKCENCITTDVNNSNVSDDINIFPNPANINTYIKFNNNDNFNIKIITVNGELINEFISNNSYVYKIDLSNYIKGVYFIKTTNLIDHSIHILKLMIVD